MHEAHWAMENIFYIESLHVQAMTKKISINVKKPDNKLTIRVKRANRTIRVTRPPQLKTPDFPEYVPSKLYRRKKLPMPLTPHEQLHGKTFQHPGLDYEVKDVNYVAVVVCHGIARDRCDPMIPYCSDPMVETEYDVIFTSKFGDTTKIFGTSNEVCEYLCENIGFINRSNGPSIKGHGLMDALKSTIDAHSRVKGNVEVGIAGSLSKDTLLTQKDKGTRVSNLEIFMDGEHRLGDVDGIFLFKIGEPCNPIADHNALSVVPTTLLREQPHLRYVAQSAHNLQSFIVPTGSVPEQDGNYDNGDQRWWMDASYTLKDKSPVKLSDVLDKKGLFPEDTTVIAYVCRSASIPHAAHHSPIGTDYTTDGSSMARSESAKSESSMTSKPSAGSATSVGRNHDSNWSNWSNDSDWSNGSDWLNDPNELELLGGAKRNKHKNKTRKKCRRAQPNR